MAIVKIPAIYKNGVITPLKPIKKEPKNIFITIEYYDNGEKKPSLEKYIESNEYKNSESETFQNMEDMVADLQKYKK